MEIASGKWISELEMDQDPTFYPQYHHQIMLNPPPPMGMEYSSSVDVDDLKYYQSYNPNNNMEHHQKMSSHNGSISSGMEAIGAASDVEDVKICLRPTKQLMTSCNSNNWRNVDVSCLTTENNNNHNHMINNNNIPPKLISSNSSSNSHIISFDKSNSSPAISQHYYRHDSTSANLKPKSEVSKTRVMGGSLSRSPLHAQDHVLAERKRREKLSQRFISLSALIPGLKKTDKASVLGDAIKYVKQLQERVSTLEEQVSRKTMESVIFVRKTQICADDETSSSDENFDSQSNKGLPEIEARVSDKDVLIRIHCEKNKGCISNIINEVEKLHLSVLNSNVLPFGHATLDITIVAKMEAEFSMTVKDLVKSIRMSLLKFM